MKTPLKPHCPVVEQALDPPSPWTHPRHLPHFNPGLETQAITYRLGDAIPVDVAQRRADEMTPDADPAYRRRIEAYLDAGHGCCALRDPHLAEMVIGNWQHFDGTRYHLLAWVVMPNHVHVMVQVLGTTSLARVIQSWKSYTGRRLPVGWQREYWDRYIRDEAHFHRTIAYIHGNPVRAGLCTEPGDWAWSSAKLHCPPVELVLRSSSGTGRSASVDQRLHCPPVELVLDPPSV